MNETTHHTLTTDAPLGMQHLSDGVLELIKDIMMYSTQMRPISREANACYAQTTAQVNVEELMDLMSDDDEERALLRDHNTWLCGWSGLVAEAHSFTWVSDGPNLADLGWNFLGAREDLPLVAQGILIAGSRFDIADAETDRVVYLDHVAVSAPFRWRGIGRVAAARALFNSGAWDENTLVAALSKGDGEGIELVRSLMASVSILERLGMQRIPLTSLQRSTSIPIVGQLYLGHSRGDTGEMLEEIAMQHT